MKYLKKPVFISWIISFTLLLFFYGASMLLMSIHSQNTIGQLSTRIEKILSENMVLNIDDIFLSTKSIKEGLYETPKVIEILKKDSVADADIMVLKKTFRQYVSEDTNVAIYLPNTDIVASAEGIMSLEAYLQKHEEINFSNVVNTLKYVPEEEYLQVGSDEENKHLVYIDEMNIEELESKIIISKKLSVCLEEIEKIKNDVMVEYAVLSYQGAEIIASKGFEVEKLSEMQIRYHRDGFVELEGTKYNLNRVNSEKFNFQYIIAISFDEIYGIGEEYRQKAFICLFICILLNALISGLFLTKQHSSLYSIIHRIRKLDNRKSPKNKNEYEEIMNMFDVLTSKNKELESKLDHSQLYFERETFSKIIQGIYNNRDEVLKFIDNNFKWDKKNFMLVIIEIKDDSELYKYETISEEEKNNTDFFVICNVFDELLEEYNRFCFNLNGQIVYVLNSDEFGECDKLLEKGKRFIMENLHILLTVARSKTQNDICQIYKHYYRCRKIIQNCKKDETNGILKEETMQIMNKAYFLSLENKKKLMYFLSTYNYEECLKIVDMAFMENYSEEVLISQENNSMLYSIINVIMQYISEAELPAEQNENISSMVFEVYNSKTVGVARDMLDNIISNLCTHTEKTVKTDNIVSRCIKIVEKEYENPNLCVTYIAECIGYHPVYLSQYFKNKENGGLPEYINVFRINKAKELMMERPDLSIEEITRRVGFSQSKTFSRLFVKYVGDTPAKWKKANS